MSEIISIPGNGRKNGEIEKQYRFNELEREVEDLEYCPYTQIYFDMAILEF